MQRTDVGNPRYYHKVVDCQWACPAHTNVPEYIRLIAQGRHADAYMLNRESNVFPGILGRTCDRPCEPACRRTRVDGTPVAICRLKRVAADLKGDITDRLPTIPTQKNGKRVALIGAGPASLTVANDLMPLGYEVVIFEKFDRPGGLMRVNIPAFRLPDSVLDEEIGMILDMGVDVRYNTPVTSMKALLAEGYDAIFVGTGAPKGKELDIPGRHDADQVFIGIQWLESVHFGHVTSIGPRVLIIGVGNTAMDCCRTSKRLGATEVKVIARKTRKYFKASPWELEDAEEEGIEIVENLSPLRVIVENGTLTGMEFEQFRSTEVDGKLRQESIGADRHPVRQRHPGDRAGERVARGSSATSASRSTSGTCPSSTSTRCSRRTPTCSSAATPRSAPRTSSGPWRTATTPRRRSTTTAWASRSPIARSKTCRCRARRWACTSGPTATTTIPSPRAKMVHIEMPERFDAMHLEVEKGFNDAQTRQEVERCLNCDIQTHFTDSLCIECDACLDVCPVDCLTITPQRRRTRPAHAPARAGAQPRPGAVRVWAAQAHVARDGEGRRRLPALRTLRRAMSHARVGHAQVPPPTPQSRAGNTVHDIRVTPATRVNDFAFKIATANGTGSASANGLHHAGDLPHGRSRVGQERLPVEHPGPADLVRDPRQQGRLHRPPAALRPHRRAQRRDVQAGRRRGAPTGGWLLYDSTWPLDQALVRPDIHYLGVPLAEMCNASFTGIRDRILLKNIAYAGALAALLDLDTDEVRTLLDENYGRKKTLRDANQKAVDLGYDVREGALRLPAAHPPAADGRDTRQHPDRRQHRRRPRLRLRGRDGRRVVSDHPCDVGDGGVQGVLPPVPARRGQREEQLLHPAGRRRARRSGDGDRRLVGRRARVHADVGPRHLADGRVHRPRVLRRGAGGHLRRPAHGSLDGHADAHAAGRPDALRLRVARRHAPHLPVSGRSARGVRDGRRVVRSRRALPDPRLRALGPRHRHERLDGAEADVGRRVPPRPREGAERRGARTGDAVPPLPRRGWRRHRRPHAARARTRRAPTSRAGRGTTSSAATPKTAASTRK